MEPYTRGFSIAEKPQMLKVHGVQYSKIPQIYHTIYMVGLSTHNSKPHGVGTLVSQKLLL
jgi:hypothetical protein